MKPFNLNEYLANPNRKLITRDGRKIKRILCTDANGDYPIVALVENYDGTQDNAQSYTKEGTFYKNGESKLDLFFVIEKQKHEGWINLYKNGDGISWISHNYFTSKEDAEEDGKVHTCSVTTIKIEWEE